MKFPGEAAERVARCLRDVGPGTVTELAGRLSLTATAIRRSLVALVEEGLAEVGDRAPYGPAPAARRGRPSQVYWLTAAGHAACGQAYDDLAIDVLRYLSRTAGEPAVRAFADERANRLIERLQVSDEAASRAGIERIAESLTEAGYAANVVAHGEHTPTIQLCQHACPIVDAATAFPELCEAEAAALGEALGVHVTRLATLANGGGVCTTVIPIHPARHTTQGVPA